jgi:hypothetical protein
MRGVVTAIHPWALSRHRCVVDDLFGQAVDASCALPRTMFLGA